MAASRSAWIVSVRLGRRGPEPRAEVGLGVLRPQQPQPPRRRLRREARGGPGRGRRRLGRRVDRDGELDVAAELLGRRAWVTRARSLVSSCSLTNSFGVAMEAVFSTSPSGRVSSDQAGWCGWICKSASPSRDRAHTSARSESATCALPWHPRVASRAHDPQNYPHVVHVASPLRRVTAAAFGDNSFPQPKSRQRGTPWQTAVFRMVAWGESENRTPARACPQQDPYLEPQ